ncbi:protein kinase domain-containing protein [Nonomuraea sp. NPDC004186]
MGTPAFMAPEQFAGGVVGPAVDLFSWASTMVFAATGEQAFKGDTMPALMHAILTTEPDLSEVPEGLRPLLARCLAKNPEARPSAEELLGLLTGQMPQTAPVPDRPARLARCWASCSCCGPYRAETHQATTDRPAGAPSRRSRWARTETCSPGRSGSP